MFVRVCEKKWRRHTISWSECVCVWRGKKEKINDRKWEYVLWFLTFCTSPPLFTCVYLLVRLVWRLCDAVLTLSHSSNWSDRCGWSANTHLGTQKRTQVTERWKERLWGCGCLRLRGKSRKTSINIFFRESNEIIPREWIVKLLEDK